MPAGTLRPGLRHELRYLVPSGRTVPHLLPEAPEFAPMPEVLATGYLVGVVEWACMLLVKPYLDWPEEQTVGVHVDLSHQAATPPGLTVTVAVELVSVQGRRLVFAVGADDGVETVAQGRHERAVIRTARFAARAADKATGGAASRRLPERE